MSKIEDFIEYERREFCKDVRCPTQLKLNEQKENSKEYERSRKTCRTRCLYTTWQFHQWLIEKGYLIVRSAERKVK